MFERAAIIGLGLIGGSIALGLRAQGVHVVAYDAQQDSLQQGLELGVIDEAADSPAAALEGADLVVLAVPVLAMSGVLTALQPAIDTLSPAAVLTDVGSVKQPIVEAFKQVLGEVPAQFVPGHPIAGSEQHGVTAATGDLFHQHRVLLTPLTNTDHRATERVTEMWQLLGAEVSVLSVAHHDSVLAQTSHLPHLLAYALIDTLSAQGDSLEIFDYAAGGLRDFSRIAASDPTMWRDIFMSNREPLLAILDQFNAELLELRAVIDSGQDQELFNRLARSKKARDHFSNLLAQRTQGAS